MNEKNINKEITVVAYGGGINSTALLIECVNRNKKIDFILFADTGAEKPHTYAYVDKFSKWLSEHGAPEIIKVQSQDNDGEYYTLEDRCLKNKMLPSLAYGFKSCSEKHKIRPQNKYINNWRRSNCGLLNRTQFIKYIGFDADESHRAVKTEDNTYIYRYPLIEWDIGRDDCIEIIQSQGLCLPGKSACYFCPSTKVSEIHQLKAVYPDLAERALYLEANAELTTVKGLGRRFAWCDVLRQDDMFNEFDGSPELICDCFDG